MGETLLQVKDLRVSYYTYAGEVQSVRGVSFDVDAGETLAIVGESGCGKSVTAKSMMGLIMDPGQIKEGSQILFDGVNILDMTPKELRAYRGEKCAMIFQDALTSLDPTMKVGRQIAEVLRVHGRAGKAEAAARAVELLRRLGVRRLGVGWGYLIGQLVSWLEENPQPNSTITDICPLVGNASIPARNYQSNENVRLMAQQMGATPHFLSLPALPDSLEEKQVLCSTEVYRQIYQQWEGLDTALVNIGDYPSSPACAPLVRYGSLLQRQRACGRMLIYYFNEDGFVIQSEQDFAIQIPIDILKRCPNIIGVCSANTSAKALRGALKSGFFTHIAARADLIKTLLE